MKINIDNIGKLETAIKEAEGKATARTITAPEIQYILHEIEDGIAKKKLHGTRVHYTGAEYFPKSYKYRPESTHWVAENINGKWYVVEIFRGICPNRRTYNVEITYSETAKQAILENASHLWLGGEW